MVRLLKILGTLLSFIVIFALSQFAAVHLVTWLYVAGAEGVASSSFTFMLTYLVAMSITQLFVEVWSRAREGDKYTIEHSAAGLSPTYILLGIALLVALSIALLPLQNVVPVDARSFPRGGWTLFAVVVLAPIFEEIIYRGKLYGMLLRDMTPFWATMLSSLCFGVVHLEPIVIIEATLSGVVFSYFYIQRRSIFSPIILHMANNAFAYLLLMVRYQEQSAIDYIMDNRCFGIIYIVSIIGVLFAAIKIVRRLRRQKLVLAYLSAEEVASALMSENDNEAEIDVE